MPTEPLDDRERLGRLIGEIHRMWRTRLNELLRPLGLSQTRWMILRILSRHTHSMSQVELANRLGVEPPTLVAILDGLTRDGFIERRASTSDRRMKQVHLTAKARGKIRQIEVIAAKLRGEVMLRIDDRAAKAAVVTLTALREQLAAPPVSKQEIRTRKRSRTKGG